MVDDSGIAQLLQAHDSIESAGRALVEAANEAGGKDNISLILVRATAGPGGTGRSWWPFKR